MAKILYARTEEDWRRGQKYAFLDENQHVANVEWQELQPDAKHNWLTEGERQEFEQYISIGSREAKAAKIGDTETIFKNYGRGVATARDSWIYNFNRTLLVQNIQHTIETYNDQTYKWQRVARDKIEVDAFVDNDDLKISWSEGLKNHLVRGTIIQFDESHIRRALYRPFTTTHLYFDALLNERRYQFTSFFPVVRTEKENCVLCVTGIAAQQPFAALISKIIPDLNFFGAGTVAQWFSFYTYDEDGGSRRENVTDWALERFRKEYGDEGISKWDIFHYVYAVLHHPAYRERYAANLKRELPRVPFAPDFRAFAAAGARLAELHVNYESQPEFPLERIEAEGVALSWRVERMKLSKDKRSLVYNDFLTLGGIPTEVFEYRLGNRSALEWVVDQYRVTTDPRSRITNDPNRPEDPQYILRLLGQVVTVSLETVSLVRALPDLGIPQ